MGPQKLGSHDKEEWTANFPVYQFLAKFNITKIAFRVLREIGLPNSWNAGHQLRMTPQSNQTFKVFMLLGPQSYHFIPVSIPSTLERKSNSLEGRVWPLRSGLHAMWTSSQWVQSCWSHSLLLHSNTLGSFPVQLTSSKWMGPDPILKPGARPSSSERTASPDLKRSDAETRVRTDVLSLVTQEPERYSVVSLSSTTVPVTQLSAHHLSVGAGPAVVAHRAPLAAVEDFQPSLVAPGAARQSHGTIWWREKTGQIRSQVEYL